MYTDSFSIYSYLRAAHLKFPAEKATYLHLAYLKELLDSKALTESKMALVAGNGMSCIVVGTLLVHAHVRVLALQHSRHFDLLFSDPRRKRSEP